MDGFEHFFAPDLRSILTSDPSFEDVIDHCEFYVLWRENDPLIVDFIIEHFDLVINYAFQIDSQNKSRSDRCLSIIEFCKPKIMLTIAKETQFFNFILEFPLQIHKYSHLTQTTYFSLLPRLLNQQNMNIMPQLGAAKFFESFVQVITLDPCFTFLISVVDSANKHIRGWLINIHVTTILFKNIFENQEKAKRCEQLLMHLLNANHVDKLPELILYNNTLAYQNYVKLALQENRTSSIEFLLFLFQYSCDAKHFRPFRKVQACIIADFDSFSIAILSNKSFNRMSESCLHLCCAIMLVTKKITDPFEVIFEKLTRDFFSYPTNSFLHNAYLQMIVAMKNADVLTPMLLENCHLYSMIIEVIKHRNGQFNASYYGQITEISKIIDVYASSCPSLNASHWEYVMNTVYEKDQIIHSKNARQFQKPNQRTDVVIIVLSIMVLIISAFIVFAQRKQD